MHPKNLFKLRYGVFRSMIKNSTKPLVVYMTPEGYYFKMFQGRMTISY